jgi:hypothetical protein
LATSERDDAIWYAHGGGPGQGHGWRPDGVPHHSSRICSMQTLALFVIALFWCAAELFAASSFTCAASTSWLTAVRHASAAGWIRSAASSEIAGPKGPIGSS